MAAKIAQKYGTEHYEIILDPEVLLNDLVEMVWYLDEPYGGGLPSWSVFKAMSGEVKVAMTGTGGDELFGNYNKYVRMEGAFIVAECLVWPAEKWTRVFSTENGLPTIVMPVMLKSARTFCMAIFQTVKIQPT